MRNFQDYVPNPEMLSKRFQFPTDDTNYWQGTRWLISGLSL